MARKGYTKMDQTVFYAEQGALAGIGSPDAGWYWDFAGGVIDSVEPNPHGPFPTYDAALENKREFLGTSVNISNPGF